MKLIILIFYCTSVLHLAVYTGNVEIVKLLLSCKNINPNQHEI